MINSSLFWVAKLQENQTYKKIEIKQTQDKSILLIEYILKAILYAKI